MRLPRSVRLLVAARAVNQLGAFSLAFLTVLLSRGFGASLTVAGAVSAGFGLATIPSRLLGGRLADQIGRRRTILIGLGGYAVAHTLPAMLAPTVAWSLGNLLLMGRAFAVVTAELAPPGATARYLAVHGLSWGFGTVAAPVVGTWLIGACGPGTLWIAMAVICLVMSVAQPAMLRVLLSRQAPKSKSLASSAVSSGLL